MRKLAIFVLVIMLYPYLARAQTLLPDVSKWNVVNSSRIDLNYSDLIVVYLGFEREYSNPTDPKEHIRVIYRHIALPIARQKEPNQYLLNDVGYNYVNQADERENLARLTLESDPILFVQWRTRVNPRNGQDMLDGDANIWLLSPSGDWIFRKNYPIMTEFLSENIGNGEPWNIFTGMKFEIDSVYHMIRTDRSLLVNLLKGGK